MSIETTVLPSGLTIVTDRMPRLRSAAIGVWVDAGARCEAAPIQGVSHFLEHMAFKGTRRRSARAIAEEIEAVGGYLNAYTGREQTVYYARTLSNDLPLALDILSDILVDSVFEKGELVRELAVILQEIGQAEDTPDDIVFDHLQEAAYPEQPLGRAILGTAETVEAMGRRDLIAYMRRWYAPSRMTVIGCGGLEHAHVCDLAAKALGHLSETKAPATASARFVGGERRKRAKLEQVHLTLALPGVSLVDPDFFTAQIFASVLGGGSSSRLFQRLREERGLCYSIYAYAQSYRDAGMIGIYAGTGGSALPEIVPLIVGEIEAMASSVSEEEIARAKAQFSAGTLMSLESPSARAEQIAGHLASFGRVLSTPALLKRIEAIEAASVSAFARRLMETGRPALAAIGPIAKLESYARLAARFGS
ncbi:MAG: insulinase family protein [Alphaproteobacteria bacterium]|nr:insulinase family protein [Alphaproteobacteria bacterium]